MAFINNDFNESISKDSVFDWGHESWASLRSTGDYNRKGSTGSGASSPGEGRRTASSRNNPGVARYDPETIDRIVNNIDDLIEDSSSSNSDSDSECCNAKVSSGSDIENKGRQSKKKNQKKKQAKKYGPGENDITPKIYCRQILVITALVAIIVAASLAIGYVIMNAEDPTANTKLYSAAEINHGSQPQKQQQQQQHLLEMAERVIRACSESKLNERITDCQQLCRSRMCCFHDEGGGEYSSSCEEDESKECAVYAGCEALLGGIATGSGVWRRNMMSRFQ